mgnify:CR=1 FL=1
MLDSTPMQDMDGLFGRYSVRSGVPYESKTAQEKKFLETKRMMMKKKKQKDDGEQQATVALESFEELATMPTQATSNKQLDVEPENIYLLCVSHQHVAEGISEIVRQNMGKVKVLPSRSLMNLIGPMWRSFPLFRKVRANSKLILVLEPRIAASPY